MVAFNFKGYNKLFKGLKKLIKIIAQVHILIQVVRHIQQGLTDNIPKQGLIMVSELKLEIGIETTKFI